ncbi:rhamnogalacturonate lyase B-like [Euphorbia lathyris]|uniref:rhamnogalacturonate lyase B-like n=1 Tax=Euphorbia lathyris TaxID=212925 RepID=UPI0033137691
MCVLIIFFCFSFFIASSVQTELSNVSRTTNSSSPTGVQVHVLKDQQRVVIDNGLVEVTFASPGGDVIGIKYNKIDNVLEIKHEEDDRGYWDVVWSTPGGSDIFDKVQTTDFKIIKEDEQQVEISFSKKWDPKDKSAVPLNVDKRYIVRCGSSGLYMYTILERLKGWPDVDIDQIRVVFKLQKEKFHFMAVSDDKQRMMPMPEDRTTGQPLAYPEAVLLTNPIDPKFKGEVDDKYQYSLENQHNQVHGWISNDPPVGFWMISPSHEFHAGGPVRQDLTSHCGPICMNMFTSIHYVGKDFNTSYRNGEAWKKVMGPVFVYLNSISPTNDPLAHWNDAKAQMLKEEKSWPYDFIQSPDFPSSNQRGTVMGQLTVGDKYASEKSPVYADCAYVGLAAPGFPGSWQFEAKGYQFWTRVDSKGNFLIKNVRPGTYSLYAWVPVVIGDFKHNCDITITPGKTTALGSLVYVPPRNGPTLWSIGIPDRSAAEFYVPDTSPTLMNKLYTNHPTDKYRQYGLWERYTDLYPKNDLVYNVGVCNYTKDWFFALVIRKKGKDTYEPTTWQIVFPLQVVQQTGNSTLQLALASAAMSEIQVRFNNQNAVKPLFTTGLIGKDNAIARHGIHGMYWLYSINVPCNNLVVGSNTIFLTQTRDNGPLYDVMYDYIRLEAPTQP